MAWILQRGKHSAMITTSIINGYPFVLESSHCESLRAGYISVSVSLQNDSSIQVTKTCEVVGLVFKVKDMIPVEPSIRNI